MTIHPDPAAAPSPPLPGPAIGGGDGAPPCRDPRRRLASGGMVRRGVLQALGALPLLTILPSPRAASSGPAAVLPLSRAGDALGLDVLGGDALMGSDRVARFEAAVAARAARTGSFVDDLRAITARLAAIDARLAAASDSIPAGAREVASW